MRFLVSLLALLAAFSAVADEALLKNFQVNGWGFVRHETKKDADYDSSVKDKTDFTQTRINVSVKADLAENYGYVFIAPQFSKISGQNEFAASSATTNSSNGTSGSLYDSRFDMHEAYFAIKPTHDDNLFIFAGRQEVAYGDHLVLGSVPWHRIGRSFDGVKGRYSFAENFNLDAFTMKLQENNAAATSPNLGQQDAKLHGAYLVGNLGKNATNADLYALKKENQGTSTAAGTFQNAFKDTNAFGARFKSKIGDSAFDYRVEGTLQRVILITDDSAKNGEYQLDLEVGWAIPFYGSRLAFEYFDSTRDYDQLFPTAHKFLGYADQFSRRNIKGQVVHFSTKPYDKVTFHADYHLFQRHDKNRGAYNFAGTSLGTTGSSRDIAKELDLIVGYDFTKSLQLSYGYSIVTPGKYIKDQNSSKTSDTNWSYLQLLARF
jgi:hypothetical protein